MIYWPSNELNQRQARTTIHHYIRDSFSHSWLWSAVLSEHASITKSRIKKRLREYLERNISKSLEQLVDEGFIDKLKHPKTGISVKTRGSKVDSRQKPRASSEPVISLASVSRTSLILRGMYVASVAISTFSQPVLVNLLRCAWRLT